MNNQQSTDKGPRWPILPLSLSLAALLSLAACGARTGEVAAGGDTGDDRVTSSTSETTSEDLTTTSEDSKPLGAGPYPIATLSITVTHPDYEDQAYTLSCLGDTATFTPDTGRSAAQACLALADEAVERLLVEGRPEDQVCTEIYGGADVGLIVGEINGQQVNVQINRVNGCGIAEWDSFGPALPLPHRS